MDLKLNVKECVELIYSRILQDNKEDYTKEFRLKVLKTVVEIIKKGDLDLGMEEN